MNVQTVKEVTAYSYVQLETPSGGDSSQGLIVPADAKITETVLPMFIGDLMFEDYWEEYWDEFVENNEFSCLDSEDFDSESLSKLHEKVFSTVDSDIHSDKPPEEEELDELKKILCADPDTVATPKDVPDDLEGKYLLNYNYPRIRELLLDAEKFESILYLLSLSSDGEREQIEAVLFRFAVSFDEKEVSKMGEDTIISSVTEEEVPLIQKRLKKCIRKVKSRDKKRSVILGLMPQETQSAFLESFFQKGV